MRWSSSGSIVLNAELRSSHKVYIFSKQVCIPQQILHYEGLPRSSFCPSEKPLDSAQDSDARHEESYSLSAGRCTGWSACQPEQLVCNYYFPWIIYPVQQPGLTCFTACRSAISQIAQKGHEWHWRILLADSSRSLQVCRLFQEASVPFQGLPPVF